MHVKFPHSGNLGILGHNWLKLFPPIENIHVLMINSMLNHVAVLKLPLPQLNVELVSWYSTKSYFSVVYNIEQGGGRGRKSLFCQCSIT
jgi:hypothetical protein